MQRGGNSKLHQLPLPISRNEYGCSFSRVSAHGPPSTGQDNVGPVRTKVCNFLFIPSVTDTKSRPGCPHGTFLNDDRSSTPVSSPPQALPTTPQDMVMMGKIHRDHEKRPEWYKLRLLSFYSSLHHSQMLT